MLLVCSIPTVGLGLFPLILAFQGKYAGDKEVKILILAALAIFGGCCLYLISSITLKYSGIHATEINRQSITLTGVAPDAFAQWLSQARVNARAAPTEAHLTRNGAGLWEGNLVLALPPRG